MLQRFMNVELEIGGGVLVPRPETELLGRSALDLIAGIDRPRVIDMCCGSGNLALAIASARPGAQVIGSDLTPETVAVARHNASRLNLAVTIVQGDMFTSLTGASLQGAVDLVVCNPPYISTAKLETESAHLLDSEPREAFDAGPYGIAFQQRLIAEAAPFLRKGGWLAFEFGVGQDRQVKALLARGRSYSPAILVSDSEGTPRVALARRL